MPNEPFGYGNQWFDRLARRQRPGFVLAEIAIIVVVVVALSSCDRISGVRTDAEFAQINVGCLDAAIRAVPNIGTVTHSTRSDENYEIAPYRGRVVTISNQWQYDGDSTASVQVLYDGRSWTYFNGLTKMGPPWPASKLDGYSPLMMRVNASIENRCGLPIAERGRISRN